MQSARHEFEQVALPWLDQLHTAALRLTRDSAEAEDLVQDTVVKAYRFWSSFQPGTNVRAWLLTILRNTFITRYHRQNRAKDLDNEVSRQMQSVGDGMAMATTGTYENGVEERLEEKVERMRVLAALDSLPEDYRLAVTLADLQGLAYKEIAEIMQCPVGTVMSRIFRGRKQLHALLFDHAVERGLVDSDATNPRVVASKANGRGQDGSSETSDTVSLSDFRQRRSQA